MINPLYGFSEICRLGPENICYERLRIAVIERKPARLDLHHDPVARKEYVVCRREGEVIQEGRTGRNRFGNLQALAISAAENIGRNHELIAAHRRLAGDFV